MSELQPLTLTFDEARALLAKKGRRLLFLVEHIDSKLTVVNDDWTKLVTGALGLSEQVVARDEAAELRAALKALLDPETHDPAYDPTFGPGVPSMHAVDRARAALAASEGQP